MSHAIFFAMSKGKSAAHKRSEVLQGTLDLMILKMLHAMGPLHGFGIARRLEQLSEDVLHLNEGTVYTSSCAKTRPRPDHSTIGEFDAIAGGLWPRNSAPT